MYTVVLADDEAVILDGIKRLIDWSKFDCEGVAEATNGQDLFTFIEQKRPQIVISDIKMPKMTGLDVIKECKEREYETKFIFISGFQEFKYAQSAIQYGAVDYLLKPVAPDNLREAIKKAISNITDMAAADLFKVHKDDLQEAFSNANSGAEFIEKELYEKFSEMDINLDGKLMTGASFMVLMPEDEEVAFEMQELRRFTVYNKLQNAFHDAKTGFVIKKETKSLHLIIVTNSGVNITEEVVLPVKRAVEEETGIKLCVGIGFSTENLKLLTQTYKSARFAVELYYFNEMDVVKFDDVNREYDVSFDDFNDMVEKAKRDLILREPTFLDRIENALDLAERIHFGNRYALANRCLLLAAKLTETLTQYGFMSDDAAANEQNTLQEIIRLTPTWRELRERFLEYYKGMMEGTAQKAKEKDPTEIAEAKLYIKEHYKDEIALKDIAAAVHVSESYFSTLFKKTTGENYKDYLRRMRMGEAIRLLINTDMKTYEIAYEVGYRDARRFADVFRGIYGMSPMEYRKREKKK